MATHSSILAWETSWTEEPGVLGVSKSRHGLVTKQQHVIVCISAKWNLQPDKFKFIQSKTPNI